MSGRFVRASKYRHVFGQPTKKELCYDNIRVSTNAWDSNLIKANGKYISVNWSSSGGGAFAVIPVDEVGKAPDKVPLFRGHTATVLDTDFNPFNDNIIISGSDDSKLGVWKIPEDYKFHNYVDSDGEIKDIAPVALYSGHKRKVGHVQFHPTAENVAASSSLDYTVKLWDVENGKDKITLEHKDLVTSFSFNYNGNLLATTSRDRKLRVWDIRANKVVSEGTGHTGAKISRVVWLGNSDRIATTGFDRLSDRQLGIWDSSDIGKGAIGGFYTVDASAGILVPFFDDSTKILYVGGKGDGNIRYFEFQDDELFPLSEYQSTDAQRGLAIAPKRTVNVVDNEVFKIYKTVNDSIIEPISFIVPRKAEVFQDDIYPDAPSNKPALSSEEWFGGKSVDGPVLFSMESLYNGSEPTFKAAEAAPPTSSKIENKEAAATASKDEELKKEESKKEKSKKEPVEKKSGETVEESDPYYSPKTKVDDLLQKDEVNSLLKKAAALDGDDNEQSKSKDVDDSNWDEEDEKVSDTSSKEIKAPGEEPKKVDVSKEAVKKDSNNGEEKSSKIGEVEKSKSEASVKTSQVDAAQREIDETKAEQSKGNASESSLSKQGSSTSSTVNASATDATTSTGTTTAATAVSATAKPLTLKGSIEKLTQVVQDFEKLVYKLEAANLEKDLRLKALEEKVQELIEKQ